MKKAEQKPKKSAEINVKMTQDLKERLQAEADRQDRSRNWLCNKYLLKGLVRDEAKAKPK